MLVYKQKHTIKFTEPKMKQYQVIESVHAVFSSNL